MPRNVSSAARHFALQLGRAIRDTRLELGLRQADLGARCGIEGSRIGEIERGAVITSICRVRSIAYALGLSPTLLLRRQEVASRPRRKHDAERSSLLAALAALPPEDLDVVLQVLSRLRSAGPG